MKSPLHNVREILVCPVCNEKRMYWTAEGVVQLDDIRRANDGWMDDKYMYHVYKCLNALDKCKGSSEGYRYIRYNDGRLEKLKYPLRLYDGTTFKN